MRFDPLRLVAVHGSHDSSGKEGELEKFRGVGNASVDDGGGLEKVRHRNRDAFDERNSEKDGAFSDMGNILDGEETSHSTASSSRSHPRSKLFRLVQQLLLQTTRGVSSSKIEEILEEILGKTVIWILLALAIVSVAANEICIFYEHWFQALCCTVCRGHSS